MNRGTMVKLFLAALVALAFLLFFALDLDRFLTLSYLNQTREQFDTLYSMHTALVLSIFFVIYITTTGLSLPGATVLTLAAGALFGFWAGLVLVSFASTIGASLAFLFARFLLRGWVQHTLGSRLRKINRGVEQEGSFYLFTLRLIPLFPFWLINLAMGLTPMRTWTFFWVSQAGMLPGTAVYVNAGRQLGRVESVGDILSWEIVLSFVLLGVFPLAAKRVLSWYRRKAGKPEQPSTRGSEHGEA